MRRHGQSQQPEGPSPTVCDVVGIGSTLVDVLAHHDDEFLERHGMVKGTTALIDARRAAELYEALGPSTEASGGSCANTIAGIAALGGRAALLGRVHDDELGAVFTNDIRASGVRFDAGPAADGPPTGRCLIVVTPDAERTMNTYLGASTLFGPDDLDAGLIAGGQVTFLEGYLFDAPASKQAFRTAAEIASASGRSVALSLSAASCVERHRDDFLALVHDRVDILFANEAEVRALWEVDDTAAAVERTREAVGIGCITRSGNGSIIVHGEETHEVPARPVDRLVDTTGAGDLYAAGFLHAHTRGRSLPDCGRLGAAAASTVLGRYGARPATPLAPLVDLLDASHRPAMSAHGPDHRQQDEPIYHLAVRTDWEAAAAGDYERSTIDRSLAEEGFIHASFAHQVRDTADRFYRDRDDIVLLCIDPAAVPSEIRVEDLYGAGTAFPHIYGPLPVPAVVSARPVPLRDDGTLDVDPLLT